MSSSRGAYKTGAFLAYGLVVAAFLLIYLRGYIYSFSEVLDPYNISIYAGIVAYVLFLTQLLLSARVHWIERMLGQDMLLRMHGFLGLAVFGAIALHGVLKFVYIGTSFQSFLGVLAAGIYIVLAPAAILILQGRIKKKVKSPPYERAKVRHNIFVAAAVLVVVHVQLASSTYSLLIRLVVIGWAAICIGAYINHKFIRPRRLKPFAVETVEQPSNDVVAITLAPPSGAGSDGTVEGFAREAGQFAYYRFYSDSLGPEEHPFTIASAPKDKMKIIARQSGDYAKALSGIKSGDTVKAAGPYGRFVCDRSATTPLYMLAGGIGITPMLSMISDPETRANRPISLLWSVRNSSDLLSAKEIEQFRDEIRFQPFFTRAGAQSHRVDTEAIQQFVKAEDRKSAEFYVCGPAGFISSVTRLLKKTGVPRRHIHSEKFAWS